MLIHCGFLVTEACHVSSVDLENDLHTGKSTTRKLNKHLWTKGSSSLQATILSPQNLTKFYRVGANISGSFT